MEKQCHFCTKEVGGAHRCIQCKYLVHLICGKAEECEEEGYGQKVLCLECAGEETYGNGKQILI